MDIKLLYLIELDDIYDIWCRLDMRLYTVLYC